MTNNLRKACEDAAKNLPEPRGISDADVADIIERHLTPVFEALRDSVIEEDRIIYLTQEAYHDTSPNSRDGDFDDRNDRSRGHLERPR